MSAVTVARTLRLYDSADCVVEVIDNWESMDLIGVRFGAFDGEGGISWATDDHSAMDKQMARAVAKALTELAGDAA